MEPPPEKYDWRAPIIGIVGVILMIGLGVATALEVGNKEKRLLAAQAAFAVGPHERHDVAPFPQLPICLGNPHIYGGVITHSMPCKPGDLGIVDSEARVHYTSGHETKELALAKLLNNAGAGINLQTIPGFIKRNCGGASPKSEDCQ